MSPTKAELRNSALKRRDEIDPDLRARFASRLAAIGPRLVDEFASAGVKPIVSLFSPIGSEPDVMPLALALHAIETPLALPADVSHGSTLLYRRWIPGDRLAAGPLGIAEPLDDAAEVEPGVLFVPLLAFDRRGHRLGYGAGNVDSTLHTLRAQRTVRVIGVAYAMQEEQSIPAEPHDQPVDIIVTDRDILYFRD